MAKLSRNSLKALVKECLVEILSEGIGSAPVESRPQKKSRPKNSSNVATKKSIAKKLNFDRVVDQTVSSLTEDSVMQEIFADTARNTLQEQYKHADPSSQVSTNLVQPVENSGAAGVDLSGIFGDSSKNWSTLAFQENKSKTAE